MNLARYVARGVLCALVPFAIAACGDDDEGTPDGTSGGNDADANSETQPDGQTGVTSCDFPFVLVDAEAGVFGEGCESNADCAYGVCMLPGAPGNITNAQFGFCSRGCDCNNDTSSQIPSGEKENFDCLYPSGFVRSHHIVVECANITNCTALDQRWTDCKLPDSGGARKVCHAL